LFAELTIDWELAAYAGLVVLAAILRFWDLGARALHHDESLHALYSWYLYSGRGYQHDPMMHGPFQFHGNALFYLIFGASDYTARMMAATFGVWIVISPYFLRRELGRLGALVAAFLFAISPSFLYFSRFTREDIYIAGFEMAIVIAIFGLMRTGKSRYAYLLFAGTALAYATKESVFITGFIFLVFFAIQGILAGTRRQNPALLTLLRSISRRDWAICIAIFLTIYILLYTTFFTNPKGLISGSWGALSYWLAQQGVQRGGQPWFYYFLLIPLYEFLPLLAALAGLVFLAARRRLSSIGFFGGFMIVWAVGALLIYSWAGEKMPWLDIHILQPVILLAAMAIAGLLKRLNRELFTRQGGLVALVIACVLAAVLLGGLVAAPTLGGTQLGMQSAVLQRLVMWVVAGALFLALMAMARSRGSGTVLVPTALGFLVALLVLTVHTAWGVVYERGDTPQDMLVYVQSSPDVTRTMKQIEDIGNRTGTGKELRVLLDGGYTDTASGQSVSHESIAWPFEWYLRDFKAKSYYSRTLPTPTDAPVILAMTANEDPIRGQLSNYVAVHGRLNWWYPEDYKGLTLEKVWEGLTDPSIRSKLWRYFLYKETLNPLGSRDFDLFIRSDLARGIALQPVAAPQPAAAAPAGAPAAEAIAQSAPGGITVLGKTSSGGSVLVDPKGVALAPDGLLYVIDSGASKVYGFSPDGTIAVQFGKKGSGDGEFNEPWGIAVAPSGEIYVADTWNHRVEKFDKNGRFLAKWGGFADTKGQLNEQQGSFWGPRDIAVGPNGNVLVTDTGNKRVEVFDSQGKFLSLFGGDGTAPGNMREPVGVAVDAAGNIYVADTWNRRIQKFDSQQRPIAQFAVSGWESQTIVNKPYLAVDQDGRIYYTEPEKNRFVVLSPTGQQEGAKGVQGADPNTFNLPIGIDVSPQGEVYVGDSRNARAVRYQSWR
jgi:uncharacterized protein (TIGR03663 family)